MPERRLRGLIRALGDERGLALPMALGITMVLSALAVGIFAYVTTNQGAARRAQADQRAYGLAETGVSYALSRLQATANLYDANAVPSTTVSLTGGTATYSGSLSGTTWTLTGSGTVPNPSGPHAGSITRTASIQAQITTTTQADMSPWDYLFVDQPVGCLTLDNSVTLDLALYVRGDLCLNNTANVHGPKVDLVGRLYVNSPQAGVGTSGTPIPSFRSTGSCYYNLALNPCGPATHVYANSIGTNPPTLSKPTIDLASWYSNADLGPTHNCTSGTFPGGFDTNGVLDVSRGDVDLTPSSAYDCRRVEAGQTVGRISWAPGSPGTLTVQGVIYVDGNITWSNLNLIQYDGKGVIYGSGQIVIRNRADLCGVAACDATWDPQVDLLVLIAGSLVAPSVQDPISGEIGNHVNFQGAIYTVTDFSMDNNTELWGPVITRNALISNSATMHAPPKPILWMNGMPAATTTITRAQVVQGSYSG